MISVDLKTKSAFKNGIPFIQNGRPVNGYKIPDTPVNIEHLEALYKQYKYSVPDGQTHRHNYFKALPAKTLSLNSLANGCNRQLAKEQLELTLLIGILNKSLTWQNQQHWFWQSKADSDFVLLREWFYEGDAA